MSGLRFLSARVGGGVGGGGDEGGGWEGGGCGGALEGEEGGRCWYVVFRFCFGERAFGGVRSRDGKSMSTGEVVR